jgi:hypothetical protein
MQCAEYSYAGCHSLSESKMCIKIGRYEIQHNDTQHATLSITTFSITALNIMRLFVTLSIKDTQHNKSAIMLSVVIFSLLC